MGSRVVWTRLTGLMCNLFIIITYVSHRGRTKAPFAADTITQIKELMSTIPEASVRVIISHANDFFSHAKNRLSHADRMRKLRFVLKMFTYESACERSWCFARFTCELHATAYFSHMNQEI